MLNFVNKKGQKVMEVKDNGDLKILDENLKKEFQLKEAVKDEQEEK